METIDKQIEDKIKKTMENIKRFDFKIIKFYDDIKEMQKAIDFLVNKGYMNLISRTLTENYIEEVFELYIFMPREGLYTLIAGLSGGIIGAILGWRQGNTLSSFPLLNPVSAGGPVVTTILFAGVGAIISATFTAILIMFREFKKIKKGYHMLTVYGDAEDKKEIKDILNTTDYIKGL